MAALTSTAIARENTPEFEEGDEQKITSEVDITHWHTDTHRHTQTRAYSR
jgi:hypothetical protein